MFKLEVEERDSGAVCQAVFGTQEPQLGESIELGGLKVTNMTVGAQNLDTQTVLMFVVENKEAISASIAANVLYDLLKGGASSIRAAGRMILSSKDLERAFGKEEDQS